MSVSKAVDRNVAIPPERAPGRWLHRWSVLLVCLVWPLVWVGGLVTTYDAGMSVPDWPGTYGYNLFLYPVETWLWGPFDLFIEHGHRLLAALVGFLTIVALVIAWLSEPRRWVIWLTAGALVAVILQGVLGGMRVELDDRTLAMLHGCVGPAFFALCTSLAVVTSRWWWTEGQPGTLHRLPVWIAGSLAVIAYVQLVLGAQLRHVSLTASPGIFTHTAATHLLVALLLWGLSIALAVRLRGCGDLTLSRPALALIGLLGLQIGLGLATWVVNYGFPVLRQWPPAAGYLVEAKGFGESLTITAHVATGSLILATSVMLWLRVGRAARTASQARAGQPRAKGIADTIASAADATVST